MKKKTKKKPYYWMFDIPMYKVQLAVRINMSAEEANKLTFDKYKVEVAEGFAKFYDDGGVRAQFTKSDRGGYAIWVKDIKDSTSLLHEIIHFVQYLYRDRRIPLTEHTEELYTYTIEYIANKFLDIKIRK